jgi:molybdopterin converting factor small subunit
MRISDGTVSWPVDAVLSAEDVVWESDDCAVAGMNPARTIKRTKIELDRSTAEVDRCMSSDEERSGTSTDTPIADWRVIVLMPQVTHDILN